MFVDNNGEDDNDDDNDDDVATTDDTLKLYCVKFNIKTSHMFFFLLNETHTKRQTYKKILNHIF